MEQIFGVFGVDLKILIVQMVNFGLLFGILWYVLYKPLTRFIEKRRAQIIEGVAKAERAETMLADASAKKASIITQAALESEKMLAQARESAKAKEDVLVRMAQEKAERITAEAALAAEDAKRTALEESKEELARMIVLGVEKTLRAQS